MLLNNSGITKTTGAGPNQILLFTQPQASLGVVVGSATTAFQTVNGRKIVKAGTPLFGNLDTRTVAFVQETTTTGTSNAVGVLLHDVDITSGNANGTLLVNGFVNTSRLDVTTKALVTAAVKTALNAKVTFIAG